MARFHNRETIDAPLDQVVRWHSLPGALTRLSPHWAQEVVREGDPTRPGSRAEMRISAPGTSGAVRVPWTAEHFALPGLPPFAQSAAPSDGQTAAGHGDSAVTRPAEAQDRSRAHASAGAEAGFGDRMVPSALSPFSAFEHRHVFRAVPATEGTAGIAGTARIADDTAGAADGTAGIADTPAGVADAPAPADSPDGTLGDGNDAIQRTEIEDTLDFSLRGSAGAEDRASGAPADASASDGSATDDTEVTVLDVPRTYGKRPAGSDSAGSPGAADAPGTGPGAGRDSRGAHWTDVFDDLRSFDARAFGSDLAAGLERFASRIPGLSRTAQSVSGGVEDRVRTTLEQTFAARTRRLEQEFAFLRSIDAPVTGGTRTLNVLITGASGLVGTQLSALLTAGGHRVRALVRRPPRTGLGREDARGDDGGHDTDDGPAGASGTDGGTGASSAPQHSDAPAFDALPLTESTWEPSLGLVQSEDLIWADVVVHLAGRSIGGRLTETAKREIRSSRIDSTRLLVDTIAGLPAEERPEAFVCASAVGWYGADRREPVAEDAAPGQGFLAEVCADWEAEAARVEGLGVRRVSVRTGLVMSSLGGLLRMQLPLYLAAAGGPLGSGEQWFPWISHDDLVRVYARALTDAALAGPVNAVAPGIVRQREWAEELGRHLHRPAVLPVPKAGPALLLGDEGADELAFAGQHAVPAALLDAGFEFAHPTLAECFTEELGPRR
ncbi:TIGR01777 family oxidoreductase [Brevibacterium album]|uniref:TIGR01777 family oxidoreductase n=1 Tax=Brevibacterium album TaxID=417948 RepID=UPI00040C64F0|nr:TIGR01777 family oxidoreductase [Brevibacterium album]